MNCIIQAEQLGAGQKLPTIRELAATLGINPNTVVRAYGELESAGVIKKTRGSGCVVASPRLRKVSRIATEMVNRQIDELICHAGEFGVGPAELIRMIESKTGASPQSRSPKRNAPRPKNEAPKKRTEPDTPIIWQPADDDFID